MRKRPRKKRRAPAPVHHSIIDAFEAAVPVGEYRTFDKSSKPDGIPAAGRNCHAIVIAGSTYSGIPIQGLDPAHAPAGEVFLWRAFRSGTSMGLPHKVDDALYYRSADGLGWGLHSKFSPDHHNRVASASGLQGILEAYSLPEASAGRISEYREAGATLDFDTPFRPHDSS